MTLNAQKQEKNAVQKPQKPDYEKLGFRCGIEIHQQLAGRKLFCGCPCMIRRDKPDFTFVRRLRASAGESGRIDRAALHEQEKSKLFEYQGYNDTTCLVEMDEEPPHPVNQEAVETALVMAKLLSMKIVDSIQFMRKTVIDGSNTSGFQRTALVAHDGFVEVNGRRIHVDTLCLEEEAAQVIERTEEKDTYNLSRLGIPLLEIATAPDITSPEECREVAAHIGMLLRSTNKCLRGIGTIRQDVNISVRGGARTEIKGFQEIKGIPEVIDNEVLRQQALIARGERLEPEVRKAEPDLTTSYLRPMPGMDRLYPETDIEVIVPSHLHILAPKTLREREEEYVKNYGLSRDLASLAVRFEGKFGYVFEEDFNRYLSDKLSPTTMADIILVKAPDVAKKTARDVDVFANKDKLFGALSSGGIAASSITEVLVELAMKGHFEVERFAPLDDSVLERAVGEAVAQNPGANKGLLMKKIMEALKGRGDGRKVSALLDEKLK